MKVVRRSVWSGIKGLPEGISLPLDSVDQVRRPRPRESKGLKKPIDRVISSQPGSGYARHSYGLRVKIVFEVFFSVE